MDEEALIKQFRLKSSLSTQNYHLFNAEGKVQKFADELEIMKEFAAIRLTYYEVCLDVFFCCRSGSVMLFGMLSLHWSATLRSLGTWQTRSKGLVLERVV